MEEPYKKALDAGVGGGRERGREVPGRSETGRDRAEERKAMRRTGAPTQADSRGRGRARGGCPGGEAAASLPPPPGGTRGQEPQVPRGLWRVAGQGRPWLGRGQAGAGGGGGGAIRRGLEPFLWACKELGSCGSGMGKRVLFGLPRKLKLGSLAGWVWDPGLRLSPGLSKLLEEISSLSHSVVFLYFFALIAEEGLAPHEGLPEILVVPREKTPTGAAARGNP